LRSCAHCQQQFPRFRQHLVACDTHAGASMGRRPFVPKSIARPGGVAKSMYYEASTSYLEQATSRFELHLRTGSELHPVPVRSDPRAISRLRPVSRQVRHVGSSLQHTHVL
jgi:hypothetical protein